MATRRYRNTRSASDILKSFVVALLFGAATTVHAQAITLDFEGLQNLEYVEDFYNGGAGSLGSSGTDHGVEIGPNLRALIDTDAGGAGNFANEPSPHTALTLYNDIQNNEPLVATINIAAGFNDLLSLYYSAVAPVTISIYDQVDGAGNQLAATTVPAQYNAGGCTGDPNGEFCNWTLASLPFSGIARSVVFEGNNNQTLLDNISLGARGGQLEPIPSLSLLATLLLATALGVLTFASKRRRSA